MTFKLWVATIGALLAVPVSALAQQSVGPADPADPRASVPAAVYESVVTKASRAAPDDNQVTPDKIWRAANDAVAAAPGHPGHEAGAGAASGHAHAGHAPAAQAAPAPSAKPASEPAADHSKHH
ncbi:hypothetical protein [Massilia niabensis]|uniref:DUF4148 domain-containing protein n=1 Tax=Massilia niabensis TaxID=544910 RepID=A0ABW0L530_9BURK